jgi:hypothetical protein
MTGEGVMPKSVGRQACIGVLCVALGAGMATFANSVGIIKAPWDARLGIFGCIVVVVAPFAGVLLLAFRQLALKMDRSFKAVGMRDPLESLDPNRAAQFGQVWNHEPRWFLESFIAIQICLCCGGIGALISGAWTNKWIALFGAWYALVSGEASIGAIVLERRERRKNSV